jgi:hypothetical protein
MDFDWQNAVALLVVVAAAGYVAYRVWTRVFRKSGRGCSSCSTCDRPVESALGQSKPLVPADQLEAVSKPSAGTR